MGEGFEKVKGIVKSVAKKSIKPFAIIATVVVVIVIIAAPYIIKKEDASHKENDWKNTPYAAEQYSSNITISPEGEITTTMTAQELWDKMLENHSRVNEYLDKPEELLKLMNAENVTKFLDTRQNPDEPIDWETLNKAITENKIQGIIKLKRADSSGNTSTMTYIAPEELQKLVDEYNKSGSEEAKQEALKHFTIQKGASTSSSLTGGTAGVVSSSNGITVDKIREVTSFRNNPQIGDYIVVPPNTEENKAKNKGPYKAGHDRDLYMYEDKSETDGLAKNSYARRKQINNMVTSNQYGMKVVSTFPNVYMVATAQKFGDDGDVVAFELSNGSIVLTCQGDDKGTGGHGQFGWDTTDEWGHAWGGNIIEFFQGEGFSANKFVQMLNNEFGIPSESNSGVNVVSATYLGNVLDGTYTGTSSGSGASNVGNLSSLDGVLFIGDSYTEGLESSKLIPGGIFRGVIGVSPDYWLKNENFAKLPNNDTNVKAVSVLLGVNNPDQIENMKKLIQKLTEKYQGKTIYVQKVFPVCSGYKDKWYTGAALNAKVKEYNSQIQSYCSTLSNVKFVDTTAGYVDSSGNAIDSMYAGDKIHLKSYSKWVENLKNTLVGAKTSNTTSSGTSISATTNTTTTQNSGTQTVAIKTSVSEAIVKATETTPSPAAGMCQKWVRLVYANAGLGDVYYTNAFAAYESCKVSEDKTNIPIGATVYGTGSGGGDGHVGIYVGNGKVKDSVNGNIKTSTLEDWIAWQVKKGGVYKGKTGWLGWGWQTEEAKTKANSGQTQTQVGEKQFTTYPDLTEAQLKAIATVCQAEQGSPKGAAAEASLMANHLEQKLGKNYKGQYPVTAQGLYDYAKKGGWFASDSTKHMDEFYIKRANQPIEYLKDDVVEAVRTVLVEGKRTLPGYIDEHDCFPDFLKVGGRDTGLSPWKGSGQEKFKQRVKHCPAWVKDRTIYIQHETVIENAYDGTYTFYCFPTETSDPFGYTESAAKLKAQVGDFCYDYDTGIGSGSTGSGSGLSNTSMSSYYAVVATWSENSNGLTSDDPDVSGYESTTTYSMTTQTIDYQNAVKAYQMPFDYLWALTVIGGNKNFTLELADLVENSELEITVHDNLTVTTTVDTQNYTKDTKCETKDIELEVEAETEFGSMNSSIGPFDGGTDEKSDGPYTVTRTTVNKTNTLDVAVTKANVWIVDYEQEYTFEGPEVEDNSSNIDISTEYPDEPEETNDRDELGIAKKLEDNIEKVYQDAFPAWNIEVDIIDLTSEYYYKQSGSQTINTKTETSKYVSSPATTTEKTDKKSDEPNFVNILSKNEYTNTKNNILSAAKWLFEILEENKNTADMVDLTKYLIYKTSGTVYDGITEFDFESKLKPGNLQTVTGMGIYGGTIQEKVWFALKDLGFNDVVVAAAMGNIDYESGGMKPGAVEGGYNEDNGGIGICQWTNNKRGSEGRNTQLKKYAQSKGVTWQDEDTQIEFLITELTGSGPASGYAEYQFMPSNGYYGEKFAKESWKNTADNESNIEYATKAFAATFERPNNNAFHKSMSDRVARAKKYYAEFHGKERSAAGFVGSSSIPGQIANGTKEQKLNYLFPDGIPKNLAEARKYFTDVEVDMTNKDGKKYKGTLTIHRALAQDVQNIFKEAQDSGFRIYDASAFQGTWRMKNNSSKVKTPSLHAMGIAIDINVYENYSKEGNVIHAGKFWNPAKSIYSIPRDGVLVKAFAARGWKWGGNWGGNYQDYMHFSITGN